MLQRFPTTGGEWADKLINTKGKKSPQPDIYQWEIMRKTHRNTKPSNTGECCDLMQKMNTQNN